MKKLILMLLIVVLVSCKKKQEQIDKCDTFELIKGKWSFVSRTVTDYKTGKPSNPATNVTVNFDKESFIEFTSDFKFSWYEVYNSKVYRDQKGTTSCVVNTFSIFSEQSAGRLIGEHIKELTPNKLIFENIVYTINEVPYQIVTLELKK